MSVPPQQQLRGWLYVFALLMISVGAGGAGGTSAGLIAAGSMIACPVVLSWFRG